LARSKPDAALEALRGRRDELQISVHMLEQAQGNEDAFQRPDGAGAEIKSLRSQLSEVERVLAGGKNVTRAGPAGQSPQSTGS
jgi:hypothetical protein